MFTFLFYHVFLMAKEVLTLILIAFVDEKGGMMFNHRRQSRDRTALQKILEMTADSQLWMNEYSASLFADFAAPQIKVDERFMDEARSGEFCLVENADISPYLPFIEKIVLFNWNRNYPSDVKFPIKLDSGKWVLQTREDFPGSSHEKITMEVYS